MHYDTIFENALVHDGSGKLGYVADVAVKGKQIAEIGQLKDAKARTRIDGRGKVLCPGFIDVHSHADLSIHADDHEQTLQPLLRQGITTFVGGNCGVSLAPFAKKGRKEAFDFLNVFTGRDQSKLIDWDTTAQLMTTLDKRGVALNCGLLAPHGIIRIAAMGMHNSLPTREELRAMKILLRDALDAGVLGMSTGLMYYPGLAADEEELVELAEVLEEYDAVFTCHLRSYSNTLPQAINELLSISRRSGARVQLSHLFWLPHVNEYVDRVVNGAARLGAQIYKHVKLPVPLDLGMKEKLAEFDKEIKAGLPLGIDAMPTGAGFTHALAFFPPWVLTGDKEKIMDRIADKDSRQKIYKSIMEGKSVWPHREGDTWSMNFFKVMGFRGVHLMTAKTPKNKQYEMMHFVDIGKARGQHPFDAVCDMLLEEDGNLLVFETPTHPGDEFAERSVYASIADPNVSIVTDTILIGHGKPSHLFYDCYPKLLSKYVRQEKMLTLQEAIRKSTSLPARQLGIRKRGWIKRGYYADLVLFDPNTIRSNSTPEKPDVYPTGVEYVFVNGKAVVTPQGYNPAPRSGRVIRRGED